ncbi:hypothetical protein [Micromonospora sp. NBC_01638]|uniref:hypothetical protein n=1 Tax=Micromonospora sp. NBC_01638 TaxID=2975982 RepID=UPI00386CD7B8|nr:hypothetical protein OG811_20225 [Micromonospora sp. NBC_01638]
MPIDEPVSKATELFTAERVLDAHWSRAIDTPWRAGGCMECKGRDNCSQLDWGVGSCGRCRLGHVSEAVTYERWQVMSAAR